MTIPLVYFRFTLKDKIRDTFNSLNIFVQPYFILERVEKTEKKGHELW